MRSEEVGDCGGVTGRSYCSARLNRFEEAEWGLESGASRTRSIDASHPGVVKFEEVR